MEEAFDVAPVVVKKTLSGPQDAVLPIRGVQPFDGSRTWIMFNGELTHSAHVDETSPVNWYVFVGDADLTGTRAHKRLAEQIGLDIDQEVHIRLVLASGSTEYKDGTVTIRCVGGQVQLRRKPHDDPDTKEARRWKAHVTITNEQIDPRDGRLQLMLLNKFDVAFCKIQAGRVQSVADARPIVERTLQMYDR